MTSRSLWAVRPDSKGIAIPIGNHSSLSLAFGAEDNPVPNGCH